MKHQVNIFIIIVAVAISTASYVAYTTYFTSPINGTHATAVSSSNKNLGYQSLLHETTIEKLAIKGNIPTWLSGTLFRNGPAQFELNKKRFGNWFDGFAMMHRFTFNKGHVSYANKFLESSYYKKALKTGKLPFGTSDQEKPKSFFSKFTSLFAKTPVYDNTNVHITRINNELVALTESTFALAFDPHTLETKGTVSFDDKLEGHVCTAHPLIDQHTGESFNVLTQFGNTSFYQIYKIDKQSNQRKLITSIPVQYPSYIHSFALTKKYIILTAIPFIVNPVDLLFSNKPFLHNFKWQPEQGTDFMVIDRATGKLIGTYNTDPFFVFHHVNAFEKNNTITIDLVSYPDDKIVYAMGLKQLCSTCNSKPGTLQRFTIDLNAATVTKKDLYKNKLESPRINDHYYGKPYSFVYAASSDDSKLIKIPVHNEKPLIWHEEGCYASEPIFVQKPHAKHEDDGVLLIAVLDTCNENSFLLILDAKTMKELGRALVPHHIPFGFHGNFY